MRQWNCIPYLECILHWPSNKRKNDPNGDVQRFQVEKLKIEIYSTHEAAGAAAAQAAADALIQLAGSKRPVAVIFATGASQLDTLRR